MVAWLLRLAIGLGRGAGVGLISVAAVLASVRASEELRQFYDIPAGDAASTLKKFADRSGRELFFAIATMRGMRTHPVRGEFSAREALEEMLAGTGRTIIEDTKTGAFSIVPAPRRRIPSRADPASPEGETIKLSPFTVRGARPGPAASARSYGSLHEAAASQLAEKLRDSPNSISLLNRTLMDDLGVTTIPELSRYSLTGEIFDNTGLLAGTIAIYSFRGITSNYPLRDGVVWVSPLDTYNLERVELLRGPSSFLHGEAAAGGAFNQLTKKPQRDDFAHAQLMAGDHGLRRATVDINRRVGEKLALRLNAVGQESGSAVDFVERGIHALHLAARYRPFSQTRIDVNGELGRLHERRAQPIPRDSFSVTDQTGATALSSVTESGVTLLPVTGALVNFGATARSVGSSVVLPNRSLLPETENFYGPSSYFDVPYGSVMADVEQSIGPQFKLQANFSWVKIERDTLLGAGASSTGVYRDVNPTLPDGSPNPRFNELYLEYYFRRRQLSELRRGVRLGANYDWDFRGTKQTLLAMASWQDDDPDGYYSAEFVDPRSSWFSGPLQNMDTLAAYQANVATLSRNFLYRRFYLHDGDRAELTRFQPLSGTSIFARDPVADGASGRLIHRRFELPSYGVGIAGRYFEDHLHTLIGWRWDGFRQNTGFDYFNPVTAQSFTLPDSPRIAWDYGAHSYQMGAVAHLSKAWSVYGNYAQSAGLSSGVGGSGFLPGTLRGVAQGDGLDFGVRASLLDGRLETNWTYYVTDSTRNTAVPFAPQPVLDELSALFGAGFNPLGADTETRRATGLEFETNLNLTENWRLTWNFSTNHLATTERFPQLHGFQASARQQGRRTPETDAFLASVPDGVPIAGFMRMRSNLITNYTFTRGALRGLSIGGGVQYRGRAFQGAYDFDGDGRPEESYAPGYTLWNLRLGYASTLGRRPVTYALNVNNIFDKIYYRSLSLSSGEWGERRALRFSMRVEF